MKNNPFDYLHRTGAMGKPSDGGTVPQKDVYRSPVKTVSVGVKREPEAPAHTPVGPREGWEAGRAKSSPGEYMRTQDGWNKSGGLHIANDGWDKKKGDRTATEMAAAPAALVNSEASAHYVPAKKAKQEFGESKKYEAAEQKTIKGLKGGKKKVMREGHNTSGYTKVPSVGGGSPRPSSGVGATVPKSLYPTASAKASIDKAKSGLASRVPTAPASPRGGRSNPSNKKRMPAPRRSGNK